jgi:hypothetical protein
VALMTLVWMSVALVVPSVARAQTAVTHVLCVTNETATQLTLFVVETPEAPGPRTGYGASPSTPYCYQRVATPGSVASIAIDDGPGFSVESIRTAADFDRLGEQMRVQAQLPPACEFSAAMVEQADVERRQAIRVRVFSVDAGYACDVSVSGAPAGAEGLDAFDTTRSGERPIYYESAERQSFVLCVVSDRRLEVAVWPQARPQLPAEFLPQARVVRTGGTIPWCSRIWLRPGGDVAVLLGAIDAREIANSPDFSEACIIGADLIAQARAGERQGVQISVTRERGQRRCAASLIAAPERAIGLNAFNAPPEETSEPS